MASETSTASLDAAQDAILDDATTYYFALHTGDPGQTGADEGTADRAAITFAASSDGSQASSEALSIADVPGSETYTHFGIWTAATGGTFLRGGSLTSSITPAAGNTVTVASGAITFTAS